ncbi:MAG: hypothetical protein IPK76_18475 [Lewinellaceae bacterium]|nr:hypothetical protein [Lewinellaceae bacterium]
MLVLGLFLVFDQLGGLLLDTLRDNSPDGRYHKAKYTLEHCDEDVVVIGSSRAEINYVSQIIEDSPGCLAGMPVAADRACPISGQCRREFLRGTARKVVILNIDDNDLEGGMAYEHAGFLRPFYSTHPEIRPVLDKTSKFEWLLLKSRLYAYNSSFYYLIRPYLVPGLDGKAEDKGWKPRPGTMDYDPGKKLESEPVKTPLNPEAVAAFDYMVDKFLEKDCQVFFVVSPNYGRSIGSSSAIEYLKKTSDKTGIPVFVYSADSSYITHPELYVDPEHLNIDGAQKFTRELVQQIKPYIQSSKQHSSNDEKVYKGF